MRCGKTMVLNPRFTDHDRYSGTEKQRHHAISFVLISRYGQEDALSIVEMGDGSVSLTVFPAFFISRILRSASGLER